jgi:Kef-type K+ transport system membrane component KefB
MSETDREVEELGRLLGPVPEALVPPLLDQRVQMMGRMLTRGLARERECPLAFVWSIFAGAAMVLLVAVLPALKGELPAPQPSHLIFYAAAGLNLLALFSGSVILIRKRREGGGHG